MAAIAVATVIFSCSGDNEILKVEYAGGKLNYEGDIVEINIISNTDWIVKKNGWDEWLLSIYPTSGQNNGTVTVLINSNAGYQWRQAKLKFSTNSKEEYVTLVQEGRPK